MGYSEKNDQNRRTLPLVVFAQYLLSVFRHSKYSDIIIMYVWLRERRVFCQRYKNRFVVYKLAENINRDMCKLPAAPKVHTYVIINSK